MNFEYISSVSDKAVSEFITELTQNPQVPLKIDTEATSLRIFEAVPLLAQIKINKTYIFDLRKFPQDAFRFIISKINDSKRTIIYHNAKYDIKILYKASGIFLENAYDTMWMEVLLNQGIGEKLYSLKTLVYNYLEKSLDKEVRNEFIDYGGPITQEQLIYSALDVEYLEQIRDKQLEKIKEAGELKVAELENNIIPVVARMEYNGICINSEKWLSISDEVKKKLDERRQELTTELVDRVLKVEYCNALEFARKLSIPVTTKRDINALTEITNPQNIRGWALGKVNVGSPNQVLAILQTLGVQVVDTKTKANVKITDTNAKTLDKIKTKYDFIDHILLFREASKQYGTYGPSFLDNINPYTHRIHTELMNLGASSGRFSSKEPNLQNIPRDEEYRTSFIAPDGKMLLSTDYSQQEYRLTGAVTREPKIISAYLAGKDMHSATAALVYNKDLDSITKEERTTAKTINFAVLYGSSEYGLSYNMKISLEKAKEIIDTFYGGYPVLAQAKRRIENEVMERGYSVTPMGRRRYWPSEELYQDQWMLKRFRAQKRREGFNHVIQGGGADITKLALYNLYTRNPFGDDYKILLPVHDEVLVEVSENIIKDAVDFTEAIMKEVEQPFLQEIPASVESHFGKEWNK